MYTMLFLPEVLMWSCLSIHPYSCASMKRHRDQVETALQSVVNSDNDNRKALISRGL